jgi:hypothetical protein
VPLQAVNVCPVLAVPNELAAGPLQLNSVLLSPVPVSCSDSSAASEQLACTPMSTDVMPLAGPSTAVKLPWYERNSSTVDVLSMTRAMPSGEFWTPSKLKLSTP